MVIVSVRGKCRERECERDDDAVELLLVKLVLSLRAAWSRRMFASAGFCGTYVLDSSSDEEVCDGVVGGLSSRSCRSISPRSWVSGDAGYEELVAESVSAAARLGSSVDSRAKAADDEGYRKDD